jgi:putative DNA primase/helicase
MNIPITYKKTRRVMALSRPSLIDQECIKLDAQLLPHAQALLRDWCGEIAVSGREITMRNPSRGDQSLGSFKFNAETGAWCDFASTDFKGYGLTLLYSFIKHLPIYKAVVAMKDLTQDPTFLLSAAAPTAPRLKPKVDSVDPSSVNKPPDVHLDLGYPSMTWEYRDTENRLSFYVYRFDLDGKKETRPVAWSAAKNEWRWQYPDGLFPMYQLQALLSRPEALVVITEGEKAADAAAAQFPDAVVVTSACGSDQALRTDWAALKGRQVVIAPDKDSPGKHYALAVAGAALAHGATTVKVIDVWQLVDWDAGDDLADHQVMPEFLSGTVGILDLFEATEMEPHVVKAAALLGRGDLDRCKKKLADALGIGIRTFEGLVKEARAKDQQGDDPSATDQGFEDDTVDPWEETVDGDALFREVFELINRHVILTTAQAVSVSCWIVFCYGFESMRICPQLLINSPSKRCGKSTLLELIMCLVPRPLPAANISSAAVFRSIESWKPTLLIDEADTFLNSGGNEEITGILNSGHNRSLAFVVRTQEVDGDHVPVRFSTFCPKVIAMIKAPADTIIDRSIVITLVRKLPTQRVDALAIDAKEKMLDTRRRMVRWTADNLAAVKFDIEGTPMMGNDRARQNWAVVAAFAQAMGPQAHAALLKAAVELSDTAGIEENVEIDLLNDIRDLTLAKKEVHIQSAVLVKELLKLKERPWGEVNRGRELTENKLARMLKPFKIAPEKFRDGIVTHRGYSVPALMAVFDRYLASSSKEAS